MKRFLRSTARGIGLGACPAAIAWTAGAGPLVAALIAAITATTIWIGPRVIDTLADTLDDRT